MNKFILGFFILVSSLNAFEPTMKPDEALKRLMDGNDRFTQDKISHPDRTQDRRQSLVAKQYPIAVVVGCSDSRTSPEFVFDQDVGDIFVVRNAGNITSNIELNTVDYGVIYLNAGLVVVLGHQSCGAVTAVLDGVTHDIESIASVIKPAISNISPNEKDAVEKATKANVIATVNNLKNSPNLKSLVDSGQILVVGAYYQMETGKVELLTK